MAPGDGAGRDGGVEMDREQVRFVGERVPLQGREGDEQALDLVVGRIGASAMPASRVSTSRSQRPATASSSASFEGKYR